MGMAAGRAAAMVASAAAAAAAVLLLLLAGGAYADCYDDCFGDCMPRNQNNRDYCSYACDKVCNPDAHAPRQRPSLAVLAGSAALADHHHHHNPMDKKQDDADAVWSAALPDHPFHETHSAVDVEPADVVPVLP